MANYLTLGRDGLGSDADEAFYCAWVDYAVEHIYEASGLEVWVSAKSQNDIQNDTIIADSPEQVEVIRAALIRLREAFRSQL